MTQATSRGMFSGCGVGLISSISGLESISPVSTSTSPAGWSIVQTNTGNCSPSAIRSAARWALIAGITASIPGDSLITRSWFVESLLSAGRTERPAHHQTRFSSQTHRRPRCTRWPRARSRPVIFPHAGPSETPSRQRSGIDEAAAVIELGAVLEGNTPDVAFGVSEAEAVSPARPCRLRVQVGDVVEPADLSVRPVDGFFVFAMDRHREAPELHARAPVSLLEDRLGGETEDDTVGALKHDVLGHARWRFKPPELAIERSHPAEVSTGERHCADPRRKSHGGAAVYAWRNRRPGARGLAARRCFGPRRGGGREATARRACFSRRLASRGDLPRPKRAQSRTAHEFGGTPSPRALRALRGGMRR